MPIGIRDRDRQWNSASVYDEMPLAAGLTSVRRVAVCRFASGTASARSVNAGPTSVDLIMPRVGGPVRWKNRIENRCNLSTT